MLLTSIQKLDIQYYLHSKDSGAGKVVKTAINKTLPQIYK